MSAFRWIVAALCPVLLWAAAMAATTGGLRGGHLAQSDCGSCHLAGSGGGVDPAQASKLVGTQEALCARCHPKALQLSHPSGFVAMRRLPADYPPDWKGELTCSTCHLVHGSAPGLLRGSKRARALCLECHDAAFFARMKDSGTSLVISGHLDVAKRGSLDIDAHSLHCLGCHADGHTGGGGGGGGSVSLSKSGVVRHSSGSAPHPIGRSYKDAERKGGYHRESQLASKKIMLSDGKVSCLSCHEAYKAEHGKLRIPIRGSELCLACHAK